MNYTTAAEIAANLAVRLATITLASGAETDIGNLVLRGRRNVDEAMVPCCVLIEGSDTITDRPGRLPAVAITQRYVIGAYVRCDANHPNDAAHAAIRDIKKALFGDGGTLDGRVMKASYRGRDIGPRMDGVPIVFVTVQIDIDYVEDLTRP